MHRPVAHRAEADEIGRLVSTSGRSWKHVVDVGAVVAKIRAACDAAVSVTSQYSAGGNLPSQGSMPAATLELLRDMPWLAEVVLPAF